MKPNIPTNTQYHYQYFVKALTIPNTNTNIWKSINNTQYQYQYFERPLTIPKPIPIFWKALNNTNTNSSKTHQYYPIPIPHPIVLLASGVCVVAPRFYTSLWYLTVLYLAWVCSNIDDSFLCLVEKKVSCFTTEMKVLILCPLIFII